MTGIVLQAVKGAVVVLLDCSACWADHAAEFEEKSCEDDEKQEDGEDEDHYE